MQLIAGDSNTAGRAAGDRVEQQCTQGSHFRIVLLQQQMCTGENVHIPQGPGGCPLERSSSTVQCSGEPSGPVRHPLFGLNNRLNKFQVAWARPHNGAPDGKGTDGHHAAGHTSLRCSKCCTAGGHRCTRACSAPPGSKGPEHALPTILSLPVIINLEHRACRARHIYVPRPMQLG